MILIFDRTYHIIKYGWLVFNVTFNQQYFRYIIGVSFNSTHFIFTKYWLSSTISNRAYQTRQSGRNSHPILAEVTLRRLQSEIKVALFLFASHSFLANNLFCISKGTLQMQIVKKKMQKKKSHSFAETCLYEAIGSLPVMPSLLPHVLWGRSHVSLHFASVVSSE